MADFRFFKMAAVRHLGFLKVENITAGPVRRPNVRHHAKFREDRSKRSGDMAIFLFFKVATGRHLGFLKVGNFNFRSGSEAEFASPCQIS